MFHNYVEEIFCQWCGEYKLDTHDATKPITRMAITLKQVSDHSGVHFRMYPSIFRLQSETKSCRDVNLS